MDKPILTYYEMIAEFHYTCDIKDREIARLRQENERIRRAVEWILSERVLRAFDGALYKSGSLEELEVPAEFADLIRAKEMT